MTEPLLTLLPGWSYQAQVLQPLAQALAKYYPLRLCPLPTSEQASRWLDELDKTIAPNTWLIGWSLGGMLAAELAARRGQTGCPGLITLCSNPCFYARDNWPDAMPEATFRRFCTDFSENPEATLSRFDVLVSQGSASKRELARQLADCHLPARHPSLLAGLELLATLDSRPALQSFACVQRHFFAAQDALLPARCTQALADLLPAKNTSSQLCTNNGHALPLVESQYLAAQIAQTVKQASRA